VYSIPYKNNKVHPKPNVRPRPHVLHACSWSFCIRRGELDKRGRISDVSLHGNTPVPINIHVPGNIYIYIYIDKAANHRICLCMESCRVCCLLALVSFPARRASYIPNTSNTLKTTTVYLCIPPLLGHIFKHFIMTGYANLHSDAKLTATDATEVKAPADSAYLRPESNGRCPGTGLGPKSRKQS